MDQPTATSDTNAFSQKHPLINWGKFSVHKRSALKASGLRSTTRLTGAGQYLETALQVLLHLQESAAVVKLPAIIGCRKDRHQATVCEELVAVLYHLMRSGD